MSSNKRIKVKEMSIDRLSALPDSVIIHILSFLTVEKAAITVLLSKRWRFLWTKSPRLIFNQLEERGKFVARVHRTLVICTRNNLKSFQVKFGYNKSFAWDINVWVEFAVKNNVKEVTLLLNWFCNKDTYTMPQMMYSNSSLTKLSVGGCILAPRTTIEWQSLTSLDIREVELPQYVLEKIISGCPVLCSLDVHECWGFNCLEINSQSFRELAICECDDERSGPSLEISAPYMQYLEFSLYPKGRTLRLRNIPSVVKAYIGFRGDDYDSSEEEVMSNTKEVFENIKHVKELKLGYFDYEVLSKLAVNGWQLPQSTRRSFVMYDSFGDEQSIISGIVALLKSSPNLETLVIDPPCGFYTESTTLGLAARCDLNCDLLHLKSVNILHSGDNEAMLTLAQLLLKTAMVLEKIVIHVGKSTSSDFAKIAQTLLSYPRFSQKAIVLLRQ